MRVERARFDHMMQVELSPRQEPFAAFRDLEPSTDLDEYLAENARTIWCDCKETPVAVVGCTLNSRKRAELWGVFDEHVFSRHPVTITKLCRQAIEEAQRAIGFTRAHIFTPMADPRAVRWPAVFGFERWIELYDWGVQGGDFVMHERSWQ